MNAIHFNLQALIGETTKIIPGHETYAIRAMDKEISFEEFMFLSKAVKFIGVTQNFKNIIDYFKVPAGETPAGFRVEYNMAQNNELLIDLKRDINYDKNGQKRPTKFIFSADSANPYEIEPIKNLIGNLTCNPGIIYDLFINDPKENIGNKYKNRDEVMEEIGRILGPGCDISVELNNPFAPLDEILEEAEKFKKMLSEYRVVIKVPHTGPVNGKNVHTLIEGE